MLNTKTEQRYIYIYIEREREREREDRNLTNNIVVWSFDIPSRIHASRDLSVKKLLRVV